MPNCVDYVGEKYGLLTVLRRSEDTKCGAVQWICACECGNEIVVPSYTLKRGTIKNCGCVKVPHHNATHGASNTKLYNTWKLMLYRCENPKNRAYKYYGQRGIRVCEEWHDFLSFKKWVDETKPDGDYTIDRIDTNSDYSPTNCRWASDSEQANNRRSNVLFEHNGEIRNLMEWSKLLGFNYKRVHNRIHKLGWTFEKAISVPTDEKKRNRVERK